ncbi:MAG: MgtC/SapB family protein [Bacteroidetes bacterium]|nr:MgtC/SapB family protein [Bacteroidota bacterium]
MSENLNNDIIKLLVALLVGAVIGAEREYKSKVVGFRTVILITLGSCLFTILSGIMGGEKDPARIAANIITGIGFLGAGAIFKEGSTVKGTTTAATIWISAAIGMSIGMGQYEFAFLSLGIVMVVLLGFMWFQNIIDKTNSNRIYKITVVGHSDAKRKELEKLFTDCELDADCTSYMKRSNEMILTYTIRGSHEEHKKLIRLFYETSLVESFEC